MSCPAEIFASSIKRRSHITPAIMKMVSDVVQNVKFL
jgi:hypothetical protein